MYEIRISLMHAASLGTMAAPVVGAGALPAGMMANQRIYLILNTATNNRYMGITTNLQSRFNGRMAVVNELGMSVVNMGVVWAWWGQTSVRRFAPPANFVAAYPASVVHGAGAAGALTSGYALPVVLPQICAAPHPLVAGQPAATAAQTAVALPIRMAVAAYQAWVASIVPRTAMTIAGAWPAIGVVLQPGVAAAASGQGTAQAAAQAVATLMGAPPAVAVTAAAAVQARATGGMPPASDEATVVNGYYGGGALAVPPAPGVFVVRPPVGGGGAVTTQTYAMVGGAGVIDLEHVFIRFVLNHLAGGFVTNGAKIGAMAWPGGAEPICVTWHSCAGGGHAIFDRSVMWWPNTVF